jgi:hypothetical protein
MNPNTEQIFAPIRDHIRDLEATIANKDAEIARLEDLVSDLNHQLAVAESDR